MNKKILAFIVTVAFLSNVLAKPSDDTIGSEEGSDSCSCPVETPLICPRVTPVRCEVKSPTPTLTATHTVTITPTATPKAKSYCEGKTVADALTAIGRPGTYLEYDKLNDIYYRRGVHAGKGGVIMGLACYENPLASTLVSSDSNLVFALAGYSNWGSSAVAKEFLSDYLTTDLTAANSCFICGQDRSYQFGSLGCFPYGVEITMGDNATHKKVQDIRVGELLWNPVLKKAVKVERIIEGAESKELIVIHAGTLTLRMSTEHPVVTPSGMKQAMELVLGDVIHDAKGVAYKIDKINREALPPGGTVVNFELARSGDEHDGLLVADGVTVGDLIIQRSLAAHKKEK